MNYIYFPELDNLAINMDETQFLLINKDELQWYNINDPSKRCDWPIPSNKIEAVKYRLDMYFLNKEPS